MKLYLDLIILLNLFLDYVLLLVVSIILKRNVKMLRIVLGALVGGVSVLALFLNFTSATLFIFKIFISILMVVVAFSYKNIKYTLNNLFYLYIISITLGGFLYFVNDQLAYKNNGLFFYHSGLSINWILVIILTPIITFIYIYQTKKLKEKFSKIYKVNITLLNGKELNISGFLDTGNSLIDPYKKRPIIMVNKELLDMYNEKYILVPCMTVNSKSMLKCFKIEKLLINGKKIEEDVLLGISDNKFDSLGVECLLQKNILKGEIYEENN